MLKLIQIAILLLSLGLSANLFAAAQKDDFRIVIDVSGSMKKTDPANLRVSAVKLLNGLLQSGSRAGVWTFGRYVNMSVSWGKVDDNWRKQADLGADAIHSNALFTNIESALARATKGWEKADPSTRRNLILLTDGQVDISKDLAKNAKSRQNILDQSIKRLRQAGARVQAIALSHDADEVLLQRLALETNGSFEIAETAEQLQKIFFKMFERAASPDSISIEGNQFKIDKSVKEMTLLVFRKPDSSPTILYPPNSDPVSAKRKGKSSWRSDEGYDLITVKKPVQGVWEIDADIDPENRLMVLTDLRLELTGLPSYVTPMQPINLSASLYSKDKQISKNSFLRFVEFSMAHTDIDDNVQADALVHSKDRKLKGQYVYDFPEGLEEGNHRILVTADSRTFSRSKRVDINVQWPAKVAIEAGDRAGNYILTIQAREEYLKPESLQPTVFLEAPDNQRVPLILENKDSVWTGIIETDQDGSYQAAVTIDAENQSGEVVKLDLGKFSMLGVYHPVVDEASLVPKDQEGESSIPPVIETEDESKEDAGPDWVMTAIITGAVNLAIVLVIFGVIVAKRRKSTPSEFQID